MVVNSNYYHSDIALISSTEFLDIQLTLEYGFTLIRVRDMIITQALSRFCNEVNVFLKAKIVKNKN